MSTATVSQPMPFSPRVRGGRSSIERLNTIGLVCLSLLLMTVFVDVNSLTRLVLGTQRIGSPLILAICLATYIAYRFRFLRGLGRVGRFFAFSFLTYLIIGSLVRLIDFSDVAVYTTAYYFQMNVSSLVILVACAPAARNAVLSHRGHRLVMIGFAVLMVTVSLLFVGKFFGASVYASTELDKKVKAQFLAGRAIGIFTNANQAGMAMALAAAFGFACLVETRRRLLVIAAIIMAGIACVTTFSRSSMLTFALVASVQLVTSSVIRNKTVILAALIAIGGFGWFVAEGYKQMGDLGHEQERRLSSFSEIASGKVSKENTGHRLSVATVGLQYWRRKPLFGHGIGNGSGLDLGLGVHALGPHNLFVLLLIEAGLPAFITFVAALGAAWYAAIRCKMPQVRTLAVGCLTVFSCNCMTGHTVLTQNYYAAALGIVFGCLSAANTIEKTRSTRVAVV